jgi:hypothetical protein
MEVRAAEADRLWADENVPRVRLARLADGDDLHQPAALRHRCAHERHYDGNRPARTRVGTVMRFYRYLAVLTLVALFVLLVAACGGKGGSGY